MKIPYLQRRTLPLVAVIAPLVLLFGYVAFRSGPLASSAVTITIVKSESIAPALSGIGTVQARYTYQIGPTYAGRVKQLDVHVGDTVTKGQILGEMEPVDLDERISAQQAAIRSAEAVLRQAEATQTFAQTQANRYKQLLSLKGTSEENAALKQQELDIANTALEAARQDANRMQADLEVLRAQRSNLRLVAPVSGLVTLRNVDPGTTVLAGQAVVEVIDPTALWVATRFDQISADGLTADLPSRIVLRSRLGQSLSGRVMRVEPKADVVTEETLAKIVFTEPLSSLPSIGELAEVTVQLPDLSALPTIPNAAIRAVEGQRGVWKLADGRLVFTPITPGRSDLEGNIQVVKGLAVGDQLVVYSEKTLTARSRIRRVDRIPGVSP